MALEFTANFVSLAAGGHTLKLEAMSRDPPPPQDNYIVLIVFL